MTKEQLEARARHIIAEIRCAHRPGCNCYRQVVKMLRDERNAAVSWRDRAMALLRHAMMVELDDEDRDEIGALLAEVGE
jgi:hypothetical protein